MVLMGHILVDQDLGSGSQEDSSSGYTTEFEVNLGYRRILSQNQKTDQRLILQMGNLCFCPEIIGLRYPGELGSGPIAGGPKVAGV